MLRLLRLTLDDLPRLGFAGQVLDEAMRLYPPAWSFTRTAADHDRLGPFEVPRGAMVARRVERVIGERRPMLRYPVGGDVAWSQRLRRLLPERIYQRLVARHYQLPQLEDKSA